MAALLPPVPAAPGAPHGSSPPPGPLPPCPPGYRQHGLRSHLPGIASASSAPPPIAPFAAASENPRSPLHCGPQILLSGITRRCCTIFFSLFGTSWAASPPAGDVSRTPRFVGHLGAARDWERPRCATLDAGVGGAPKLAGLGGLHGGSRKGYSRLCLFYGGDLGENGVPGGRTRTPNVARGLERHRGGKPRWIERIWSWGRSAGIVCRPGWALLLARIWGIPFRGAFPGGV